MRSGRSPWRQRGPQGRRARCACAQSRLTRRSLKMNNYDRAVLLKRFMDLAALHIFKTVAETGGITKAAARLHRVQSNVTTRVKQLEESLGTPLFHRHKRRLTLSAEGKLLLAYAERLLRLSSEAQAALRSGAPRGTLRIGSLESTAATRLPPVLSRYHAAYPEVRLELLTRTTGGGCAPGPRGAHRGAVVAAAL